MLQQITYYEAYICLLISLASCSQPGLNLSQVNGLADEISSSISRLWEDISRYQDLQKAYEESLKKVTRIDRKKLLNESVRKMEQYFSKKIGSLQRIKTRAATAYAERKNGTVTADEVKYVNMNSPNNSSIPATLQFNQNFNNNINTSYSGIQIPTNVYDKGPGVLKTINWTSGLNEVFIDNFMKKDNTLKWQYFGSRDAVFRTYPAKLWTNPYYSARRRPWYTQGATSPKDMVILVDSSGSMVGKSSLIGRLAVSNLIDTLSDNDFFNVLYFNTVVKSLSCNKTLVQATKQNREWFKSKLKKSGFKNVALWKLALREAFEILKKSDGAKCQKVIMIFSDGTEENYEDVFEHYNKNKEIRVFTYLLGSPTPSYSSADLKWMACSNKGYFYKVPTVGAVRDLIEDYVSVLSRPMAFPRQSLMPVWTGVYRDASGLGMMVTATLPVFHEQTFLGVCGTDVTINELTNFVYQPHVGAGGYAFIIDNNGHIVKHPNLRAVLGYVKSAGGVDLTEAEFVPDEQKNNLLALREKMLIVKNEVTEEKSITGLSFTEYERYLRITPVERTFTYTKIDKTPFSLCITSSKFGYEVQEYYPYPAENVTDENSGAVLLEDWKHCNVQNLPLKSTPKVLRLSLQKGDCNDNLLLDLNITQNAWSKNISRYDISAAFVKTNWGLLRVSQSISTNLIDERLFERVGNFETNPIILSAPYNNGELNETSSKLLVYKGIQISVSKMTITPAVSGFEIGEEIFLKHFLMNISEGKYNVYLLDENAFIVSSSFEFNSENVSGQFFGSVDWELMSELEKGSEPLYTRFTLRNEQGECLELPSKSSSSTYNYPFYTALASSITSWTKNVLACLLQLNIYNLLFTDASATATQNVKSQKNRSCVTNITAYYGNITRWKSFSGNTSCLACGDFEMQRQFFTAPVHGTNLLLVVVDYFAKRAIFHPTKRTDNIPGKPTEVEIKDGDCSVNSKLPRGRPERCVLSQSEEKQYSCGRSPNILEPNTLFILLNILYQIIQHS